MQTLKFILLIALSAFVASCSLIERLEFDPTNTGNFSAEDLPSYRNNYLRVSSYTHGPGYINILNRGRVEMTGMYSLNDSTTAGLTQLGQIDLVIDFNDKDETSEGRWQVPIVDGQISRVTDLGGGRASEAGVGWEGTLPITGFVYVTKPVGADDPTQLIAFEAKGTLRSISPHGEAGSERRREMSFSGTFMQEVELGIWPLSASGKIDSTNGQSDFYLEEVR
ncbi:MAG: hypothetical protein AB7T38_12035 [Nitrospirales bacterium]